MASGAKRIFRGSVVGTGSDIDVTNVGFRPTMIKLMNVGDGQADGYWQDTMPDGSLRIYDDDRDGDLEFLTTGGITPLDNGFRIGDAINMNEPGDVIHFYCVN